MSIDTTDFNPGQFIKLSSEGEESLLVAYTLHAKNNVWFGRIIDTDNTCFRYQAITRLDHYGFVYYGEYYVEYSSMDNYYSEITVLDEMQVKLLVA